MTTPTPVASEMAIMIASKPLETPDKVSPAKVSLIALVIATPGKKIIIDPIIMELKLDPNPKDTANKAKNEAIAQQLKPLINRFVSILSKNTAAV